MVARDGMGGDAMARAQALAAAWFLAWRRWLTRLLAALGSWSLRLASALVALAKLPALLGRFVLCPSAPPPTAVARRAVALAGVSSLAIGAILSVALARALRVHLPEAAIAVAWTLGWAGLRLGILSLASPDSASSAVRYAWAAGLLPAALGITDPLRLLALAASAWLTLGALQAAGVERREARRAWAWAFGAEGVAMVLRWLASGVLLYLVTAR